MKSSPIRILLAEDDELFRLGLRMRLQQQPEIEVVAAAEDGETAVELAKQHSLDLVLLDIGLPGIEVLKPAVKSNNSSPCYPCWF